MRSRTIFLLLVVFLADCVTTQRQTLPAGHPEVDVHIAKGVAIEAIANMYSAAAFTIKTVNDYSLVVEKPDSSMAAGLLFGSKLASTPNVRVTISFAGVGDMVHIQGRVEMVTNPGSAYEHVTDISASAMDLQKSFEESKAMFEGGAIGIGLGRDLVITQVVHASPAEAAGIHQGDKIEQVAGESVSTYERANALIRGVPGSSVQIVVSRSGGARTTYTVERKRWADLYGRK
jgi:S1-C subfamily serine protease